MSWDEVIPYSVIFEEAKRKKVEGLSGFDWCGKVFSLERKKLKYLLINTLTWKAQPTCINKEVLSKQ